MARERWFFAHGGERRGPLALGPLLSALVQARDARSVLVWRRGLADWTRAEDVPEVEQRLAPLLARPTGRIARIQARMPGSGEAGPPAREASGRGLAMALAGAGFVVIVVAGWLLVGRRPSASSTVPLAAGGLESAPAIVVPSGDGPTQPPSPSPSPAEPTPSSRAAAKEAAAPHAAGRAAAAQLADAEASLPAPELRKLRGVAAWAGETLKLTVYNGTAWRVTELSVRVARFSGDEFVFEPQPLRLLPPGGAVDTGVADLLQRVVPERKKPGLNALDTGAFAGHAGPPPESYRWEIEAARGYPPAAHP